ATGTPRAGNAGGALAAIPAGLRLASDRCGVMTIESRIAHSARSQSDSREARSLRLAGHRPLGAVGRGRCRRPRSCGMVSAVRFAASGTGPDSRPTVTRGAAVPRDRAAGGRASGGLISAVPFAASGPTVVLRSLAAPRYLVIEPPPIGNADSRRSDRAAISWRTHRAACARSSQSRGFAPAFRLVNVAWRLAARHFAY